MLHKRSSEGQYIVDSGILRTTTSASPKLILMYGTKWLSIFYAYLIVESNYVKKEKNASAWRKCSSNKPITMILLLLCLF